MLTRSVVEPNHPHWHLGELQAKPAKVSRLAPNSPRKASDRATAADEAMTRYGRGENVAFETVYDEVAPRIERYLRRHMRETSLVEDIVQQTFEHMHRARGTFVPSFPVLPWAFTIAKRLMLDCPKRCRREVSRDMRTEDDIATALFVAARENGEEMVQAVETKARLLEAFNSLSAIRRSVFEHAKIEGLSYATVAATHGITEDSVRMQVHRACKALRAVIEDAESLPGSQRLPRRT
jgi:RNA polymerase sigma-70 factor (ECF subfamily)